MNVTIGCSKLCIALSLGAVICIGSTIHQPLLAVERIEGTAELSSDALSERTATATATETIAVLAHVDLQSAVEDRSRSETEESDHVTTSVAVSDSNGSVDELYEVWEISTRHLPDRFRCINNDNPGFDVHRFECGRGWVRDSLDKALADDGRLPIIYVHGNFMERNNSLNRVLIINNYLRPRARRPYRLIMFSWPSQRESKPLHDVFENAESAECQSLYVAWLLEKLGRHSEVSVLGFSFGARSVTGGLHLALGGSIPGFAHRSVAPEDGVQSVYRVGLVAPCLIGRG